MVNISMYILQSKRCNIQIITVRIFEMSIDIGTIYVNFALGTSFLDIYYRLLFSLQSVVCIFAQ